MRGDKEYLKRLKEIARKQNCDSKPIIKILISSNEKNEL